MSGGWLPVLTYDPNSLEPAFEQIRAQIVAWIVAGRLAAGAELPSVRQIARDLGIAPNTVVRAYDELERDGWVVPEERKGFRVAKVTPEKMALERERRLREAIAGVVRLILALGVDPAVARAEFDRQLREAFPGLPPDDGARQ